MLTGEAWFGCRMASTRRRGLANLLAFFEFYLSRLSSSSYSRFMSTWFPNSYICSRITTPYLFYLRTFIAQPRDPFSRYSLTHRVIITIAPFASVYTMVFY